MKKITTALLISIAGALSCAATAAGGQPRARWITAAGCTDAPNTWIACKTTFDLTQVPQSAPAQIAVDSKYWLWVNGEPVVFEGGLKRGPTPEGTYYDVVDIAPALKEGENDVSVLVWYFGKNGFSHKSSGAAGLLFDCPAAGVFSGSGWRCAVLPEYRSAGPPKPNYRLPEASVQYDARIASSEWWKPGCEAAAMNPAEEADGDRWGELVRRPIPQWKDHGMSPYTACETVAGAKYDTIVCSLPYNAHITPWFDMEARAGDTITVMTDNYLIYNGGAAGIRCEYIAREGRQQYENPGWMNGHRVYYVFPKGTVVHGLEYRETGYDTDFAGAFTCSDPFFDSLWKKSLRTLYVTMRDTYMDCPDRERAQWTGDAVNETGEAFYALSPSSYALSRKWLHEVVAGWQKPDGSIYAPVPSGNYSGELPAQSLATVGYYGLWTYYLYSGDIETLAGLYDNVQRYLGVWEQDGRGLVKYRKAGWNWGDWGSNRDMLLLYNLWYYLAVKGMGLAAAELGKADDAAACEAWMRTFRKAFDENFWTGSEYRDPEYRGLTDDRVHALAVVSGMAGPDKYPQILEVFRSQEHASPYMEKYVFEAMMQMGCGEEAMARHEKRFAKMVAAPFTTLFEGWGIGREGFGGGTVNHAWSGGALTVLSQYACGVAPTLPAWSAMQILPLPGSLTSAEISVPTLRGDVESSFSVNGADFLLTARIPAGCTAVIGVPAKTSGRLYLDGREVWREGRFVKKQKGFAAKPGIASHIAVEVSEGSHSLEYRD